MAGCGGTEPEGGTKVGAETAAAAEGAVKSAAEKSRPSEEASSLLRRNRNPLEETPNRLPILQVRLANETSSLAASRPAAARWNS